MSFIRKSLLFGCVVSCSALLALGQSRNRQSAILYSEENYRGVSFEVEAGKEIPARGTMRRGSRSFQGDQIRSIQLNGDVVIELWEDTGYRGRSILLSQSQPALNRLGPAQENWKDRVASFKVYKESGTQVTSPYEPVQPSIPRSNRPQRSRGEVKIFEDAGYQGDSMAFDRAQLISNLRELKEGSRHWNDRISSIYINGPYSVVLYKNAGFDGGAVRINQSVSNLKDFRAPGTNASGWNDSVSSLEIVERQRGREPVQYDPTDVVATLFEDDGYGGDSLELYDGQEISNLRDYQFNDELSSLMVQRGYRVELYQSSDFRGTPLIIETHTPSLKRQRQSRGNWNDTVSSVKVSYVRSAR